MKRNVFLSLLTASALLIALAGCKDDDKGPGLDGPAVLAIQNAGTEPLEVSLLEPKSRTVDIRAVARSISAENVEVTFKVDRSLVEAYNKTHGTSYEIVPSGAYDFTKKEVLLPRYNEVSSTAQVTLKSEGMPDGDVRLLPIAIDEIRGDQAAQAAAEGGVMYILFNKRILPPAELLDRTGWSVVYVINDYAEGKYPQGLAEALIDGDSTTYWTYDWTLKNQERVTVPLYIVFDMGREVTVRGVRISARLKNGKLSSPPCDFTIETTSNPIDFTLTEDTKPYGVDATIYTYKERFSGLESVYQNSVYLTTPQRARYIRFTLHNSWSGAIIGYTGGTFAEFDVWGNEEELNFD